MTNTEASTSISVRGEAQRTTAPDEAQVLSNLSETADSKSEALLQVQAALSGVLADLAGMGGKVLTADTPRAALTWSKQSIQTHDEHTHDKATGAHGPTGRHQASVTLLVNVRDFALLGGVAAAMTDRNSVQIHSVNWSVDDDNAEWALVRADAIHAALIKGQDYAAALGGRVVTIDHVADAGLLGGDGGRVMQSRSVGYGASASLGDDLTLDPVPQLVRATIEARFTAMVNPLPAR